MIRIQSNAGQFARLCFILMTIGAVPIIAQQAFVPAPHRPIPQPSSSNHNIPAAPRSMVGGYWRIDANYKSVLYLKNSLAMTPLTVTRFST